MKVHEFAMRLGIPPSKVRFYDRSGVISGGRSKENNYREYKPVDALNIYNALMFRSFDMSISETAKINSDCRLENVNSWLDRHIRELEEHISLEKQRLSRLRQMQEHFSHISAGEIQLELQFVKKHYDVWTFGMEQPLDTACSEMIHALAECLPYSYVGLMIPEKSLFSDAAGPFQVWAGLGILEENVSKCGIRLTDKAVAVEGQERLLIWLEKEDPFALNRADLESVFEEARRRGLTLYGDAVGRIYLSYTVNNHHVHSFCLGICFRS